MNVVRRDSSAKTQNYYFHVADRTGWSIIYKQYEYPDETDKPRGAVRASLTIQEIYPNAHPSEECLGDIGYFNETIFLGFDGTVSKLSDNLGFSPVICRLKKLDELTRDEIRKSLSDEVKELFDKGLESYTGDMM